MSEKLLQTSDFADKFFRTILPHFCAVLFYVDSVQFSDSQPCRFCWKCFSSIVG